jgi:glycogen(starch) synthase
VTAGGPHLAILSYSYGDYDARSFRIARSAVAAGYRVTLYARWAPGLPTAEDRDGYRVVRVDSSWRMAVPWLRAAARERWATAVRTNTLAPGNPSLTGSVAKRPAGPGRPARGWKASRVAAPARVAIRLARRARGKLTGWLALLQTFPLRPIGWSVALDEVAQPADLWHGMWAGSLPALVRMKRRFGGHAIYDSRDVYLQSRQFQRLEWPLRPILAGLERRWAHRVDRVITVNEAYADLIAAQLRVPRPAVVLNTPERWTPPDLPPDRIREALGVGAGTRVVLYQGQLIADRGIEQAAEAVLSIPDTILVLLGFGPRAAHYRAMTEAAPYAGRVHHLPPVPPDELLSWTASADVAVMAIQPSSTNHEFTTPQKLWEAMAAGVPVVASDLPGMAEVIRETGAGVLCDPTSPASIAAALRQVLDAAPEERLALRRRVLATAHERYTWESQAATLFGLYATLLDAPRRGRR